MFQMGHSRDTNASVKRPYGQSLIRSRTICSRSLKSINVLASIRLYQVSCDHRVTKSSDALGNEAAHRPLPVLEKAPDAATGSNALYRFRIGRWDGVYCGEISRYVHVNA